MLNVSRDASAEEIREAWRSMAVLLHPDKQPIALKSQAEARFRAVQRAYEVLSDEEKRAVYDHLGLRALGQSWALTTTRDNHAPDARQMRMELERAAMRKAAEDAEALVKSRGDFECRLDASTLFCHAGRVPRKLGSTGPLRLSERLNRVGCTQLVGRHGFEVPVGQNSRATLNAQMISRAGAGAGNLIGSIKTQWSPRLWSEFNCTALKPHVATAKAHWDLNQLSFFTFVATQQSLAAPPDLNVTYGQRLSSKSTLTGFTSFKLGHYVLPLTSWGAGVPLMQQEPPSITIGLTSQSAPDKGWTAQTTVSSLGPALSLSRGTRLALLGGARIKSGISIGAAQGVDVSLFAERRVTESTKLMLGLSAGIPRPGLTLRIRVSRLGQKLSVPVLISPEFRSDLALGFLIIPAAALLALEHFYLKPSKRSRITNRLRELRGRNKLLIRERLEAAKEARLVLNNSARLKARRAWDSNGLLVLSALYGRKEHFGRALGEAEEEEVLLGAQQVASRDLEEVYREAWQGTHVVGAQEIEEEEEEGVDVWDVRIPLQALAHRDQITIHGGRAKSSLLGFFDPCMGERKHLLVRYLFRGRLHQVIINDVEQLTLPLRAHQV
ncbi:Molecular chaperone (DnaJ superfamily) [Ceraceosorus bombacis]|uniref:Molecular chaperone (DnaJ superfamily) n=1 Tax=Ceraceosorus bombacis TaxID=401625 RepID=A0A0P1BTG9_9BASI|nr:Molecular chaperone (DnaJ superfamily) [Ceraceosorus bombacis]